MMQTQTQIPPALQVLMSMGASPQAPGPGGQPVPTVATQMAMAAEPMAPTPQGISGLLPGANVAAQRSVQAQQPVTQAQLQQAMSQRGVAGLPAPNMGFADGGVVGYEGGGLTLGAPTIADEGRKYGIQLSIYDPPEVRAEKIKRIEAMREFANSPERGVPIPTESSQANQRVLEQAFSPAAQEQRMRESQVAGRTAAPPMAASTEGRALAQNLNTPTQFDIDPNNPQALNALRRAAMSVGGAERQALMNKIGELESAQATRSMPQAAPTGVAALAERPTYDTAGIAAAGTPYMKAGEEDVGRLRKAEGERAAFEKTLPDLSAKGIAALEAAEQERQRMLGTQRGDDKFNRQIALLRGFQGDRGAYDRVVAGQQARDESARQAQLAFEQSRLLLEKAQQERQLGRFDRAIALEREASALMEKARDNALKAQEVQQRGVGAQFQGNVQMRGQDMTAQTAIADRNATAALRNLPTYEQQIAEKVMNDWMSKNPGKTLSDAWDYYRAAGKGLEQRAEGMREKNDLARQRLLESDTMYAGLRMAYINEKDPAKKAEALRKMKEIERLKGIVDEGETAPPTQLPPGVKVTRVGP